MMALVIGIFPSHSPAMPLGLSESAARELLWTSWSRRLPEGQRPRK